MTNTETNLALDNSWLFSSDFWSRLIPSAAGPANVEDQTVTKTHKAGLSSGKGTLIKHETCSVWRSMRDFWYKKEKKRKHISSSGEWLSLLLHHANTEVVGWARVNVAVVNVLLSHWYLMKYRKEIWYEGKSNENLEKVITFRKQRANVGNSGRHGLKIDRQVSARSWNTTQGDGAVVYKMAALLATWSKERQRSVIRFFFFRCVLKGSNPSKSIQEWKWSMVVHVCHSSKCVNGEGSF